MHIDKADMSMIGYNAQLIQNTHCALLVSIIVIVFFRINWAADIRSRWHPFRWRFLCISSTVPPQKSRSTRFPRSNNIPESTLPPSVGSLYPDQHPSIPPPDRLGHAPIGPSCPYSMSQAHGMYTPVYDSRRGWRPALYPREGGRSNSLPQEVFHSTVYQPPIRERYNSLDSPYCSTMDQRAAMHRAGFIIMRSSFMSFFLKESQVMAACYCNIWNLKKNVLKRRSVFC